ncbi:MAG: metallo-mystery pair system four-Cys motif protein [Bradymonadaceae bacterium]|nr:metallo-mystery pair system four-Cys motif protein [Lujinxingiaceae bacterium]
MPPHACTHATNRWLGPVLAALLASACGAGSVDDGELFALQFEARVGAEPFVCGRTFDGLGASASSLTPSDFRLYVHDVHLIGLGGELVAVTLEDDGKWQRSGVALLDFEDRSGPCANGTTDTNRVVRGRAPAGDYRGVQFTLGVPFALNHADASTADSPLNLSAMFWGWNAGYKFLRIDAASPALPGYRIHLGSTGCEGSGSQRVSQCRHPNRAQVTLERFDVREDVIVADLAELLAGVDLDTFSEGTAQGCMSDANDPDCTRIYENLGLVPGVVTGEGDESSTTQRFFRRR